jgi:hypothetical protein
MAKRTITMKMNPTTAPAEMSPLLSIALVDSEERVSAGAAYALSSEVVRGDGAGREAPIAARMNRVMIVVSFILIIVIRRALSLNSVSLEFSSLRNV